jgi:hypothetical protein
VTTRRYNPEVSKLHAGALPDREISFINLLRPQEAQLDEHSGPVLNSSQYLSSQSISFKTYTNNAEAAVILSEAQGRHNRVKFPSRNKHYSVFL